MGYQTSETLCVVCARAGGCTIPGDLDEPVLSCNMFEQLVTARAHTGIAVSTPDPSRMEGLCVDCGNRRSCMFRQPEGGMWHCEEYC